MTCTALPSSECLCHIFQADYNGAIEDSTKSIELQPQYIKAIRRRAQAYEKTEKLDDALKDYKTIHDIEPRNAENIHTCLVEQIQNCASFLFMFLYF